MHWRVKSIVGASSSKTTTFPYLLLLLRRTSKFWPTFRLSHRFAPELHTTDYVCTRRHYCACFRSVLVTFMINSYTIFFFLEGIVQIRRQIEDSRTPSLHSGPRSLLIVIVRGHDHVQISRRDISHPWTVLL